MDTNNDDNNASEGGGSAADLSDNALRHTNRNTNDKVLADGAPQIARELDNEEESVLPPEVWASVMECKLLLIYCCTYY